MSSKQFSTQLPKSRMTSILRSMEEPQNIKIKTIEDKYRKMLSNYEEKKKVIDAELAGLKSGQRKMSITNLQQKCDSKNFETSQSRIKPRGAFP